MYTALKWAGVHPTGATPLTGPTAGKLEDAPLQRPPIEHWLAGGAVLIALLAHGLTRIPCDDIGWHLATARLADARGAWPTTNTFSYTYPDYPLFQQYPLFQKLVYFVYEHTGWEGLSLLRCGLWTAVFLLFVRWGGSWAAAAARALPWMIAMMAMQRRMLLRPEVLSMAWLAGMLLVIDRYRNGSRRWYVLMPLLHVAWVNSHQLFPIGLAVQVCFLAHLVLSRRATVRSEFADRLVPIVPVLAGLAASIVLSVCSPRGLHGLDLSTATGGTLLEHRMDIRELAPIWTKPVELSLALACGSMGVVGLWRGRRAGRFFEAGLWLMMLALVISANRGLAFFALVSVGVLARSRRGGGQASLHAAPSNDRSPGDRPASHVVTHALTLLLAGTVVFYRWVQPPAVLGGTQPGLGRTIGDWPDAATAFLRQRPPPGRMMNLPWSLGDAIIWQLPEIPTFVDARFESYPRDFLRDCIESSRSDQALRTQIDQWAIDWIFADHRSPGVQARVGHLAGEGWTVVYADWQTVILVRDGPRTAAYRAANDTWTMPDDPPDLVEGPAEMRALQRVSYGRLLAALGVREQAERQMKLAAEENGPESMTSNHVR